MNLLYHYSLASSRLLKHHSFVCFLSYHISLFNALKNNKNLLIFCEGGNHMNIKPNIGILQALIRITCGLTLVAWSTSKLVKQPWNDRFLFFIMMGAMKVAEGIVRYCPIVALFEKGKQAAKESNNTDKKPLELLNGSDIL